MKQFLLFIAALVMIEVSCKKEKKALAVVSTLSASSITSSSAQTGGAITDDGNSLVTKRGVCWALHSSPTVGDSITNDGSGTGAFTSSIANLNANTTYYIRAYAINASGTAYGNEVSFATSPGLATVITTAITGIAPLSANSGGTVLSDGGAAVTQRGVVWSTNPNPTISNSKTSDGAGTGSFTSIMSPLASQTVYYVRAYAINSFGTAYGNQLQFSAASANTVTDVDGNVYPYVTIGTQNWMASNLKVTKYKNGDPIVNGYSQVGYNWATTTDGAYTYPNADVTKKDSFGLMYNLYAIRDNRGVCPTGWHVPSDGEWQTLEFYEGMASTDTALTSYRGTIGGKLLEGGTSGLNLQLAGYLNISSGAYSKFRIWGLYYSSSVGGATSNWYRGFNFKTPDAGPIYRTYNNYAMSVRCVKD